MLVKFIQGGRGIITHYNIIKNITPSKTTNSCKKILYHQIFLFGQTKIYRFLNGLSVWFIIEYILYIQYMHKYTTFAINIIYECGFS